MVQSSAAAGAQVPNPCGGLPLRCCTSRLNPANKFMRNVDYFAFNQYRDYIIYKELAKIESDLEFKSVLESLIEQEYRDYSFWLQFSQKKRFSISAIDILRFKLIRKVLGLTFAVKFLEGRERNMINAYSDFLNTVGDEKIKNGIIQIIEREREHEKKFIGQIKEERVEFLGNVVLGLNDGLIELSGALIGFSFAFFHPLFVALSGLIVGFSASLSMASSAYMQARHEEGKEPLKAALYTGLAYLVVVVALVAPFFIFSQIVFALISMAAFIVFIIVSLSFYSSVLLERPFFKQVIEMSTLSVGVAIATFAIGLIVRQFMPALSV